MKNFTKQNFKTNPLWIRLLIMTFMLLAGAGNAWGIKVYFDNTNTKWSKVYLIVGHGSYSCFNNQMSVECGNIYSVDVSDWSDESQIAFHGGDSWGCEGNSISHRYGWHNGPFTHPYDITLNNASGKVFTPAATTSNISTGNGTKKAHDWSDVVPYTFNKNTHCCSAPTSVSISRGIPTSGNICEDSTIDLTATVTGGSGDITYAWTKTSGGNDWTIANASAQKCTVTAGTGSATFEITATRCGTSKTNTITLTADAKPAITLASPSSICTGTEIDLTRDYVTSKTGTVIWYSDANRSQEITNGIVTPINTGTSQTTNTYYAKVTNGVCSAKTDVSLSIKVDPQSAITLKEAPTICQGTTITFANYVNTSTGTVTWHTDANCTSAAITTATPNQTTTYYAKATSGDCTPAKASLKITVNNKPAVPTLSADNTSLVSPDKATLTAGNTTNGLTYTLYNGETAGESQKSTGGNLTFKVGEAGNYTVRVSNSCGTSTSTVVTITVCTPQTNEFRHANSSYTQLANQPTYYPGDKVYFVSTGNCCLTGTWSANLDKGEEGWWTGLTGSTPNFSMTLTRAGEFTITNMATNGCTQDKNVRVDLDFTVTALSQVTNANGTASGADIALTWKHSANHTKVMVVRYPTAGTETIPAGGQSYSAGNTLGEGTVVYVGTSESYTDKNLPSGESYKYYFYTVNNNYYSDGVVLNMSSCPIPAKPSLSSIAITACNGECTAQGYIIINNINDYDNTFTFKLGNSDVTPDENGKLGINSTAYTQYTVTVTNSCGNSNNAQVDIAINDNKPTITGNNSIQPRTGSTELTSDKGANTVWKADGGTLSAETGASVTFSADTNGKYIITAIYNGCETEFVVSVQDDLYVWVRRPIKKEKAYTEFFHEDQNSTSAIGGDLFYKEFASLPSDYTQYNQGGKKAEFNCEDKEGYMWYGFKVSKEAIAGNYYFTVHAPNDGGTKGTNEKYNGWHTHTYATQLVDMDADLYFVMDETPSNVNRGWNINAPVVLRASGDAKYNANNFADFVSLYVKDANTCTEEVSTFEWQKSTTQNGAYTTYNGKSGKGINNIRTAEAGWYRCVVTYASGNTATSNAIQVTSGATDVKNYDTDKYDVSKSTLPIIMVNTNGVGFPSDPSSGYPSAVADDLKEKRSVDVKISLKGTIVYDKKARMNYRGSSSLNFKKKSYAFCPGQDSCVFDKGAHDYVKTKKAKMFEVLGDASYKANDKDWVLYAATPDPSMMRNRLVFDLYQKMRPEDWGVHTKYVELIVDGEYQGVYVFMDKITANENRVNIKNSDGFIVKFDKTDCADRVGGYNGKVGDEKTFKTTRTGRQGISTYGTTVDQLFEIEYPEKEDIEDNGGNWEAFYKAVQKRWEDFETALANGEFSTVRTLIDYDSWADWFILTEFIKNQDGFRASCIFVYDGGKIKALPLWDQELSFDNCTRIGKGSNDDEGLMINNSSVYSDCFPAPFWFTGKNATFGSCGGDNGSSGTGTAYTNYLLKDPCFVSLLKSKWATYQTGVLSYSEISKMVTTYTNEVKDAQPREAKRWPYDEANRGKTSNGATIGYYGWEGDSNYFDYSASKGSITTWAKGRSTALDADGGLGKALNALNGEALIFTINPGTVETSPWIQNVITVNAPEGYDYTIDFSALEQGTVVKENGDTYTFKVPRPSTWGTAGNGTAKTNEYTITATIDAEGENACGAKLENTATAKVKLNDVTENCDPQIVKPQ